MAFPVKTVTLSADAERRRRRLPRHRRSSSEDTQVTAKCSDGDASPPRMKPLSVSSLPPLEVSEVSFDPSFRMDDPLLGFSKENSEAVLISKNTRDSQSTLKLPTMVSLVGRHSNWAAPEVSSHVLYGSILALILPSRWILYAVVLCLLFVIQRISSKWACFYWNDREVIRFRRTCGGLVRHVQDELNMTLSGDYSRQVMASYIFYACTAPGESTIGAFIRYKSRSLNMQFVEEIDNWWDRFHGYEKAAKTYAPFG